MAVRRANVSAANAFGAAYRSLLETVALPEWLVTSVIESRLARHFYSDDERERMFARWTGRAAVAG